jgi:hypothetical protein
MDLKKFIDSITFNVIQPDTHVPTILLDNMSLLGEMNNTFLPENDIETKELFKSLVSIKKMSTFAVGSIINKIVKEINPEHCFLNVGLWCGFSFFSGIIGNQDKKCIGIDNFSEFSNNDFPKSNFLSDFEKIKYQNEFYEMDYKDYLDENHKSIIDFYIYDGKHDYYNQYEGLKLAEPFFSDNCIILVDDTNIEHVREANLKFISDSKNNYKLIADKKTKHNKHPTFWNGIMIFQRV